MQKNCKKIAKKLLDNKMNYLHLKNKLINKNHEIL